MTLADLRGVAVRRNLRIRFSLSNGMECVVDERGVARIPALKSAPAFNLEAELASAARFLVEPAGAGSSPSTMDRAGLEQIATGPASAAAHEED